MKKKSPLPPSEEHFPADEDLPEGWKISIILDVCEVNPPKPPKDFLPADAPVTFVPMHAVDAELGAVTNPEIQPYLNVRNGFTSFRDGDVIMAKITPCMENGKAAIIHGMKNGIGFGSTEFHVMRSRGEILPEYLYYYIRQNSFRKEAENHFTGSVGQKRVPADFIKQSLIPLPHLPEQQRIVARVEALLTNVNAARERLHRVPLIMKKFRQAVLAAACEGRLTEGWRDANPDVEPTKISQPTCKNETEKYLENLQILSGLEFPPIPDRWISSNGDAIFDTITSGSRGWAKYYSYEGATFIRIGNLTRDSISLDLKNVQKVNPPNSAERKRIRVQKNDILISITADIGSIGFVSTDIGEAYVNQHIALCRPVDQIDAKYVALFLLNINGGKKQFLELQRGATKIGLGLDDIKAVYIPLPPLAEQDEIVRRVGMLFERADAIDREVEAAGQRCERLTQAVLGKAFRGELVENKENVCCGK